jgi:hypothetical protein
MAGGPDATLDALARTARSLLADRPIVALQSLCAEADVPRARVKAAYLEDPAKRRAFEEALGAHCVDAEGGCFLVR